MGEDNVRKTERFKIKSRETKFKKYGNEYYNNRQKSREPALKNFGKDSGFIGRGKSYSKISQELFWEIYKDLPERLKPSCYFAELNKEFCIKTQILGTFISMIL